MYDAVPATMRTEKAWVNVWKNSKIPMRTTTRKSASSADPESWGTFADAVQNVADGVYDGIGYVFHGEGLVGIDIDKGFDDDGFLSAVSIDIATRCGSYTERSRSGRGIHVILGGQLHGGGLASDAVEVYDRKRYFIVTGQQMLYSDLRQDQSAVDHVVEKYFPNAPKETGGKHGERIYAPTYSLTDGRLSLSPTYPPIPQGMRNVSLASLAGQMHRTGYPAETILSELVRANNAACKPPLPMSEVRAIVDSIRRYKR